MLNLCDSSKSAPGKPRPGWVQQIFRLPREIAGRSAPVARQRSRSRFWVWQAKDAPARVPLDAEARWGGNGFDICRLGSGMSCSCAREDPTPTGATRLPHLMVDLGFTSVPSNASVTLLGQTAIERIQGVLRMSSCDPLESECPLDLTEDDCRTLIRLLRHAITPDREPFLPQLGPLRVILDKLEFAVGG